MLRDATPVSDNPVFDAYWLSMWLGVTWGKPEVEMVGLQSVVGQALQCLLALTQAEADSPDWRRRSGLISGLILEDGRVLAANIVEAETRRQRIKHRALQDARYLWRCWQTVQHAVCQLLLNRLFASSKNEGQHIFAKGLVCPAFGLIQSIATNPLSDCASTERHSKRSDETWDEGLRFLRGFHRYA